jgi:TonB family protein
MSAQPRRQPIRWETWQLSAEADRRFRRTLVAVGVPFIALTILVALWELTVPPQPELQFNGQQFVKLLPEVKPKAAPEVAKEEEAKPAKAPEKKPEPKPQAKKPEPKPPAPQPTAREIAAKALTPLADQLRDLRDESLSAVTTQQALTSTISSKGGVGSAASADAIAASAAAGGGALVAGGSVTNGAGGTGLGNRTTGSVRSTIPNGGGPVGGNLKAPAARTPAEIQAVFEKNQGPFYAIYNRAARENASISRGKLIVRIVIAPSGAVISCTLISSSFGDAEFERKIVERVKLLGFGAKNVPDFTIDYPINFIPQ